MFLMQANRHRSGAQVDALADSTAGQWCRGRPDEDGQVGE
jgi:hypothetical protein